MVVGLTSVSVNSGKTQLLVGHFSPRTVQRRSHVGGLVFVHVPLQLNGSIFALKGISGRHRGVVLRVVGNFGRFVGLGSMRTFHTYTASTVHSTRGNGGILGGVRGRANVGLRVVGNRRRTRLLCGGLMRGASSGRNDFTCVSINNNSARIDVVRSNILTRDCSCGVNALEVLDNGIATSARGLFGRGLAECTRRCNSVGVVNSNNGVGGLGGLTHRDGRSTGGLALTRLGHLCSVVRPLDVRRQRVSFSLGRSHTSIVVPTTRVFLGTYRCLGYRGVVIPGVSLTSSVISKLCRGVVTGARRWPASSAGGVGSVSVSRIFVLSLREGIQE